MWDATCPDTVTPSHIAQAIREAGAVGSAAELKKRVKCQDLLATCEFVAVLWRWISGAIGPEATVFLGEVALANVSGWLLVT